jgi:two-component system NarL family sensor kinase
MARAETDTEKLQKRNRELVILNAIADALNRPVDLEQSLGIALAKVAELLDLQTGWIFLMDEETGVPYLAATQNLPPALAGVPARLQGSCYCLDTYRAGDLRGAANVNVVTCSRLKWLVDGTEGLRYHSSIPLYAAGRKLGVLNVASTDWRELSPDDLRLLYTVGDLLSIAVERSRLFAHSARVGAIEERNRLAREIHDTLAQGLAAIALQLETADALLETHADVDSIRRVVATALEQTRLNLDEARRSVLDLRAAPLESKGLAAAIEELVSDRGPGDIAIGLKIAGRNIPVPARIELGLYRITQEALSNALRHANARHVDIRLAISRQRAELTVSDDGDGFDTAEPTPGSYGLVGMNERVRLLGGTFELASGEEGTRITVVVPIPESTQQH